jgi:hypothetical protein
MEGWRQGRLGSKEDHSNIKGNYKTDLTLTGLLMEGLGAKQRIRVGFISDDPSKKEAVKKPGYASVRRPGRECFWSAGLLL